MRFAVCAQTLPLPLLSVTNFPKKQTKRTYTTTPIDTHNENVSFSLKNKTIKRKAQKDMNNLTVDAAAVQFFVLVFSCCQCSVDVCPLCSWSFQWKRVNSECNYTPRVVSVKWNCFLFAEFLNFRFHCERWKIVHFEFYEIRVLLKGKTKRSVCGHLLFEFIPLVGVVAAIRCVARTNINN